MNKRYLTAPLLSLVLLASACSTVPITGRSKLSLVNDVSLRQESAAAYSQMLRSPSTKVLNNSQAAMVKTVGNRIKNAVVQYMNTHGYGSQIQGYQWEFNLIDSPDKNAFCMPGGKVAVYSGILPLTQNDAGLATVMSHEIAHAIAQHSAERASQMLAAQVGGSVLDVATAGKSSATRSAVGQLYGLGAQGLVILPYSRTHELEADRLGLIFMAMAGYNPNSALTFWQRMAAASRNTAKPPEVLSTHPADETRIAAIQKNLPEAMRYYTGKSK